MGQVLILKIKKGVDQKGAQPVIWFAIGVAYRVFADRKMACRVTSLTDPAPGRELDSLHPDGLAVDLGARRLTDDEKGSILRDLRRYLVPMGFDVLLHGIGTSEHFHIEYQPTKYRYWQLLNQD